MIEIFSDMPEGTFGGRIAGTLTRDDYTITLLPILRKMRDSGRPLRVLVVLEPDFAEQPGAVWERLKADVEFGIFWRPGVGALRDRDRYPVGRQSRAAVRLGDSRRDAGVFHGRVGRGQGVGSRFRSGEPRCLRKLLMFLLGSMH
jgi:hypothetical protein